MASISTTTLPKPLITTTPSKSNSSHSTKSLPTSPTSLTTTGTSSSTNKRKSVHLILEPDEPFSRKWTPLFQKYRKRILERLHLQSDQLHNRLKKLIHLLSDPNKEPGNQTEVEKSLIQWQSDDEVNHCPHCSSTFTFFSRKHHCRLCGLIICGTCSRLLQPMPSLSIRICHLCSSLLSLQSPQPATKELPFISIYEDIVRLRNQISTVLPTLNEMAWKLIHSHPEADTPAQLRIRSLAMQCKKELGNSFNELESCCEKLTQLPTPTATQKTVHTNLIRSVTDFLALYLPQLELVSFPSLHTPTLPPAPTTSFPISKFHSIDMPHPYLETLFEQYSQVESYLKEAQSKRRFEQVKTLSLNLEELKLEIDRVQTELQDRYKE